MKINSILSKKSSDVITIGPAKSISEAIALLAKHNIGALVVTEGDIIVGIISERDIVRKAVVLEDIFNTAVREVMTQDVIVGLPQDDIMSVANTMTERRFRHLPITDGGKLIGIISIGDVLKAQRDKYLGEIDTLETQLMADD